MVSAQRAEESPDLRPSLGIERQAAPITDAAIGMERLEAAPVLRKVSPALRSGNDQPTAATVVPRHARTDSHSSAPTSARVKPCSRSGSRSARSCNDSRNVTAQLAHVVSANSLASCLGRYTVK